MSALADYRTAVLALVDDASLTRYTNAQVDQALRWALMYYTAHRPLIQTYHLDTDGNGIMELPSDFEAIKIIKVEVHADDIDAILEIPYYAYKTDEAWFIQTTDSILAEGETLNITYSTFNTIDDLDSAAGTTIPAEDEHLVQLGAAGHAIRQRATSRAESNNLNVDTIKQLMAQADSYISLFTIALTPSPAAGFVVLPAMPTNRF